MTREYEHGFASYLLVVCQLASTIERGVDALRAGSKSDLFSFPSLQSQISFIGPVIALDFNYASRAYTSTPLSMEVMSIVDATAEPCRSSRA
jgi:hypothetical protein